MMQKREALRIRGEYAVWSGRKAFHQMRLDVLRGKYILEQDDVNRLERSIFSKWKRGYDEKLEKEQAELDAAKREWERVEALMKAADEKLPALEEKMKELQVFWKKESGFDREETILLRQCEELEKGVFLARKINLCILHLKDAQQRYNSDMSDQGLAVSGLQGEVDGIWRAARGFVQGLQEDSAYDLDELQEDSDVMRALKTSAFRRTRSLAGFGELNKMIRTNSALYGMEEELQDLRERLAEVFEDIAAEREALLERMSSGESHFCEREEVFEKEEAFRKETSAEKAGMEEQREDTLFQGMKENQNLDKLKERLLYGLELLYKDLENSGKAVEQTKAGGWLVGKMEKSLDAETDRIVGWERALQEWKQELKQYRKDAGNFPCALDSYVKFAEKAWQYTEEEEKRRAYREHMKDAAKRVEQAAEQLRDHKK